MIRLLTSILPNRPAGGAWLAAPLRGGDSVAGALLLHARVPDDFEAVNHSDVALLAEPVSALLENDRRLSELEGLREVARSEHRAILARTGRDDSIDTIIGTHGGLRPVMERVALVADSDVPVLILGETGSGKEVIARAIHERSDRRGEPFIRVNCGAIPPDLVDSELFGHERGAFTGAVANRRGWFERADGGTLLLDEIGELPVPAQVRLLRVLQEGTFERVGGEVPIRVDVRIVAATHRDLPTMIRRGRFREDLWYRIASFPILLPPLRERREDIPELAGHFVDRAARRFGLRPLTLDSSDLDLLTSYAWPGNIRELASIIDRAAILGAGETLDVAKALGSTFETASPVGEALATSGSPSSDRVPQQDSVMPSESGSVSMAAGHEGDTVPLADARPLADVAPAAAGSGPAAAGGAPLAVAGPAAAGRAPLAAGVPLADAELASSATMANARRPVSTGMAGAGPQAGAGRVSSATMASTEMSAGIVAAPSADNEFPSLDKAMRVHIERALALSRGQIEGDGGAARLLDINPHTLRARMRKLDIDWTRFRNGVG